MAKEVTCRRCGETFSSMRSRCPNCGTRRVVQSSRTPGTTPGTVKGTAAYKRQDANAKWQLVFGLILVVSVILAVTVMVTTSLDGLDGTVVRATPTPYVKPEVEAGSTLPEVYSAPTPTPEPERQIENIRVYSYTTDITDEKNWPSLRLKSDAGYRMQLKVMILPSDIAIEPGEVVWTCDDESVFTLTPDADNPNVVWGEQIGAKAGGVQITATVRNKSASVRVYLRDE